MTRRFVTIILAAGKGVRMKSDLAKVLHPVNGQPMIHYVIQQARMVQTQRIIVIIGHQKEKVREALSDYEVLFIVQEPQLGTGHAVQQAGPILQQYEGDVLVLSGDVPLIRQGTLSELVHTHQHSSATATLLTAKIDNPFGYGRVLRDVNNQVVKVVEEKDASANEKTIDEINVGIYVFNCRKLFHALKKIRPDNSQNEYYLPDVISIFQTEGKKIAAWCTPDFEETQGINTLEQLKKAERTIRNRQAFGN